MDVTIAHDLYQAIDEAMKSTLGTGTAKVMLGLGASFGSMWLVHFTLKSIYWLFQGMDVIFQDVIMSIFKMAFIMAFAFNVDWYISNVVPFVTGLPNWMGEILSGLEGPQNNQVDALIKNYVESFVKFTDGIKFGLTDDWGKTFNLMIAMAFYLIGGIPFLSMCVGTMVVLKFATSIILVVGPIFIALALFDQTRQWFWGWVSTLSGFMLTYVFFSVAIGIEINYITRFLMVNGGMDTSLMGAFTILIVFAAFTMLATQLPGYAASITGGAASGGMDVPGIPGAKGAARLLGAGAKKAGGKLAGAIGKRRGRNRIE